MVREDLTIDKVLTRAAFENAIVTNAAIGGSTNFLIHLLAIAGRIGVPLRSTILIPSIAGIPLVVNLQPSGRYFMEESVTMPAECLR